jgi:hypothetical protein
VTPSDDETVDDIDEDAERIGVDTEGAKSTSDETE